MKVLFFDTETSGIENGRLVQLAYKEHGGAGYSFYYRPPVPIEIGAMAVHHVTNEMAAEFNPLTDDDRKQISDHFNEYIAVAHNANFDIGILENEGIKIGKYIDTLRCAQHLIESDGYSLQYLRYFLKLQLDGRIDAHEALSDVLVLEKLFEHLYIKANELLPIREGVERDVDVLNHLQFLTLQPVLLTKMPFGKHKGMPFREVPRSYITWLRNQTDLSEDMVYSLNYYSRL